MKQLPGPIGSCEDDPIHSPGAVQSHGAMRVCSADLRVVATSESDEADSRELSQLTAVLRGSVA